MKIDFNALEKGLTLIGVKLYDNNGDKRSVTDVFGDVSDVWEKLPEEKRQEYSNIVKTTN